MTFDEFIIITQNWQAVDVHFSTKGIEFLELCAYDTVCVVYSEDLRRIPIGIVPYIDSVIPGFILKNWNTFHLWDRRFYRNSSLQAMCDTPIARVTGCVSSLKLGFFVFFSSHFYLPASGQAVVTGVVPCSPRFLPSIFIVHRVQQSHCSSMFHQVLLTHAFALPQVYLCTRTSPHEFIRVCSRRGSNSRNLPKIPGSRITWYATGATGWLRI